MARRNRNHDVELDMTVLNGIIDNLDSNVAQAIAKTGFAIEAKTKINIQQMDAIDTGAMLNSTYTSLTTSNGETAMGIAKGLRPGAEVTALPKPENNHTAYVGPTVEYAQKVHFGSGRMAARPFLLNAVRDTESEFRRLIAEAVSEHE